MERRRSARGAVANPPTNGTAHTNSSSDDDAEGAEPAPRAPATQRQSARRKLGVDLSRLEPLSLKKYRKCYKLGDGNATKEEMLPTVMRHWQNQVLEEDETIYAFAFALRKQATQGTTALLSNPGKLKQKAGAAPKPKAGK